MGLLDGQLATTVCNAFRGKLSKGVIRKSVVAESGALDSYGDPIDVGTVDTALQGFAENYSAYFRATAGIPETDIKVNIFAMSCPGIIPEKDDKASMTQAGVTTWYQLRSAEIDPAGAMWICRAFPIAEPE